MPTLAWSASAPALSLAAAPACCEVVLPRVLPPCLLLLDTAEGLLSSDGFRPARSGDQQALTCKALAGCCFPEPVPSASWLR